MTKLTYTVRLATAPGESEAQRVPVLVNRKAPVTLTKVVENAIDRGRILGAKAAASRRSLGASRSSSTGRSLRASA